jgi:hypothetical protein
MDVLSDPELRANLRHEGVKVTADLTVLQRNEIQHYRDQGLHAYFKNDRIRVEERKRPPHYDHGQRRVNAEEPRRYFGNYDRPDPQHGYNNYRHEDDRGPSKRYTSRNGYEAEYNEQRGTQPSQDWRATDDYSRHTDQRRRGDERVNTRINRRYTANYGDTPSYSRRSGERDRDYQEYQDRQPPHHSSRHDGDEANDWNPYWPRGGTQHYDTGDVDDYGAEWTHPWWDGWQAASENPQHVTRQENNPSASAATGTVSAPPPKRNTAPVSGNNSTRDRNLKTHNEIDARVSRLVPGEKTYSEALLTENQSNSRQTGNKGAQAAKNSPAPPSTRSAKTQQGQGRLKEKRATASKVNERKTNKEMRNTEKDNQSKMKPSLVQQTLDKRLTIKSAAAAAVSSGTDDLVTLPPVRRPKRAIAISPIEDDIELLESTMVPHVAGSGRGLGNNVEETEDDDRDDDAMYGHDGSIIVSTQHSAAPGSQTAGNDCSNNANHDGDTTNGDTSSQLHASQSPVFHGMQLNVFADVHVDALTVESDRDAHTDNSQEREKGEERSSGQHVASISSGEGEEDEEKNEEVYLDAEEDEDEDEDDDGDTEEENEDDDEENVTENRESDLNKLSEEESLLNTQQRTENDDRGNPEASKSSSSEQRKTASGDNLTPERAGVTEHITTSGAIEGVRRQTRSMATTERGGTSTRSLDRPAAAGRGRR